MVVFDNYKVFRPVVWSTLLSLRLTLPEPSLHEISELHDLARFTPHLNLPECHAMLRRASHSKRNRRVRGQLSSKVFYHPRIRVLPTHTAFQV